MSAGLVRASADFAGRAARRQYIKSDNFSFSSICIFLVISSWTSFALRQAFLSHAFSTSVTVEKKKKIPVVLARRYFFLNIAAIRRAGPGMAIPFTVRLTDKPHLIGKGAVPYLQSSIHRLEMQALYLLLFFGGQNFFHKFLFSYLSGIFPGTFPFSFYIIHAAFYSNKNFLFIREHLPTPFPSPFWLSLNPEGEAVGHRSDLLTRFFRVFRRFSRCSALSAANWEQLPPYPGNSGGWQSSAIPQYDKIHTSGKNRVPALEPGCKSPNEILKDALTA